MPAPRVDLNDWRLKYEPSMPGLQWASSAVGNGRWRGVKLADILKRAGLKESRKKSSSMVVREMKPPPTCQTPPQYCLGLSLEFKESCLHSMLVAATCSKPIRKASDSHDAAIVRLSPD